MELGFGTGLFAADLINQGYRIDGVEPRGKMLEKFYQETDKFRSYIPKIFPSLAQDFPYENAEHDFIYSHSGPFFFVNDHDKLYLEGMRHDQVGDVDPIIFHENLLQRMLHGVAKKSSGILFNIQEDRTDIPLKNGDIVFQYNREGDYDIHGQSVVKYGRFLDAKTNQVMQDRHNSFTPYRRYALPIEKLQEVFARMGNISMSIRDNIWVLIEPHF